MQCRTRELCGAVTSLNPPLMLIHPPARAVGPGTAEVHSILPRHEVELLFGFLNFFYIGVVGLCCAGLLSLEY